MFSKLHNRLGTAGLVVAIVALVVALAGTAFAAAGLNSKQKKEVKSIAKSFQGTGPQGSVGPAGAPGAKGDVGGPGAPGTPGTNGKSVVITNTAPSCTEGGKSIEVQGEPTTKQPICNGEEGTPGTNGQPWTPDNILPEGATETGAWGTGFREAPYPAFTVPLSFPIPLGTSLGGSKVHYINPAGNELPGGTPSASCQGSAAAPSAAAGNLCVYAAKEAEIGVRQIFTPVPAGVGLEDGAAAAGALLQLGIEEEGIAYGTWAVTAPTIP